VAWGDYDDGDLDFYVSNMDGPNRLYRNDGHGTFTDVAPELGVTEPRDSFCCWWWDYDNDGRLDLFVTGFRASLQDIVAEMLGRPAMGERPRWDRRTLARILENPAYKGTAAWGKTQQSVEPKPRLRPRRGQPKFPRRARGVRRTPPEQWSMIPVPALVDEETFAAAQEQLAHHRAHQGRPAVAGRYVLHGLLVCGRCGCAYCGKHRAGRKARRLGKPSGYYRCGGADAARFGGQRMCSYGAIRTDRLDAAVLQDVSGLLPEPGRVEAEYRRRLENQAGPSDHDREGLGSQITGVMRRIARLTGMYEDGFLEREDFQRRMTSAQSRLRSLEDEAAVLAEQTTSEAELRLVMGHLEAFAERMRLGLGDCDWETRQAIVRALVKRIEIGETEVRVVYKVSPAPFERAPQGGGVLQNCGRRQEPSPGATLGPRRPASTAAWPREGSSSYAHRGGWGSALPLGLTARNRGWAHPPGSRSGQPPWPDRSWPIPPRPAAGRNNRPGGGRLGRGSGPGPGWP
jgi:hypothetical protein